MKIIFLVIIFFQTCAFAQKIEKFYNWQWNECEAKNARFYSTVEKKDSGNLRNDYFIIEKSLQMKGLYSDESCKTKNGKFWYFYNNSNLSEVGNYENNEKTGLWIGYHKNGMMSDSSIFNQGNSIGTSLQWYSSGFIKDSTVVYEFGDGVTVGWFDNGSPSYAGLYGYKNLKKGRWKYFHKNGNISATEEYENGKIKEKKYFDEDGNSIVDSTNVEASAVFSKGEKGWNKYISKNLYFPKDYKFAEGGIALVVVNFVINEDGDVEDIVITNPLHPAFDKIVEDVIKNSPKWIPAKKQNRKVKSSINQSVNFSQNDSENHWTISSY